MLQKPVNIAYVQIDTLLNNMKMYEDLSKSLAKKQKKMETEFSTKYKNFQDQVNDFQNKVQKGLLTTREAQEWTSSFPPRGWISRTRETTIFGNCRRKTRSARTRLSTTSWNIWKL